MASGAFSGVTNAGQMSFETQEAEKKASENEKRVADKVRLPQNSSQIKHIFRNDTGHLSNTPENQKKLLDLANDPSKFKGCDSYGTYWNSELLPDGSQNWVRYRNNVIINGGNSKPPREWDDETGFNSNPRKNGLWRKKK